VHWEYQLFKAIEDEIAALETSNREKLLGKEKKKKKKKKHLVDTDDPDAIVDLLDARQVIDTVRAPFHHVPRLIQVSALEKNTKYDGACKENRTSRTWGGGLTIDTGSNRVGITFTCG